MSGESSASRPIFVTIVGILYILPAILSILYGIIVAAGVVAVSGSIAEGINASLIGAPIIVAGLISFIIGYGILKGWRIMWYLGVIFAILSILGSLLMITAIVGIVSLVINIIILYYLFRPGVKAFFRI